jgi:hypothetical protein
MTGNRRIGVFSSVLILFYIFPVSFTAKTRMPLTGIKEKVSIPKRALLEDIDHFVGTIEESHADPYRLISRDDFLNVVSRLKDYVRTYPQDELSFIESFYALQELAAALQDEHTAINFPVQYISKTALFFPFKIKILGGKMFVEKSLGNTTIPEFSEILEINKVQTPSIWKRCLKYMNPPLPHAKVNMFGKFISTILTTLFDMHSPWIIRYRSGGKVNMVEAEGINGTMLFKALLGSPAYQEYSIEFNGKEIPVLDIPSFAYGRYQDYEKFIDNFFYEHQNKEALIIDLRRNPGGNGTWGYYMLDYLTDSPYKIIDVFDFKVSEIFRTSGYRNKAGDNLEGAKNGEYIPIASNRMRTPQNKGNKFQGRVFLLVSHTTDSAGVVTAAIFKHSKMGTVIGQETAGRIKFNSDPVAVKLPNSGLRVYIPVAIYALPGDNPDRGVIPDIVIDYSIEDLKKHSDKEIDKIKELLTKIY